MSYFIIEVEEEKKKQLLGYYHSFMCENKSKAESYDSLDEFKKSAEYQALSGEEKEHFKQYEGKKVMVLVFDNDEQAMNFIKQAQSKGLIKKEQAEAAIYQLNEQNQSTHTMRM